MSVKLPSASTTKEGTISTGTQTVTGAKQFNSDVSIGGTVKFSQANSNQMDATDQINSQKLFSWFTKQTASIANGGTSATFNSVQLPDQGSFFVTVWAHVDGSNFVMANAIVVADSTSGGRITSGTVLKSQGGTLNVTAITINTNSFVVATVANTSGSSRTFSCNVVALGGSGI